MRIEDPLRLRDHVVGRDVAVGDPLADVELGELDIDADQIAAFPRDDEDAAVVGRLDQRLEADVGKVGDGQHVHHAPGVVGGIAVQLAPDRLAHRAARAVAADDIARLDGLDLPSCPASSRSRLTVTAWSVEARRRIEVWRSSRRRA